MSDQPIAARPTAARLAADARALIAFHALGRIDQDGDGGRADRRGAGGEAAPPAAIQPEVTDPLVVLIQAEPGMAQRLLSAHADDGTGRCRTCSTGAQTGRFQWPCTIHKRAHQAHEASGPARTD